MNCAICKYPLNPQSPGCPNCGHVNRPGPQDWVTLKTVYPPEDIFLKGMLESFGIPVRLLREAIGPVQGLTLGPLAEVKVMVPCHHQEQARILLDSPPADPEP